MLSKEDNELLCRVGPGTPMGNLFRQYWLPAMKSDELPVAGLPAGAHQAAGRGADRLPHNLRRRRPDPERLPASRRLDVLRTQRRRWPALRLPRLEVRRQPAPASTCPPSRPSQLQEQSTRQGLPHARAQRHHLGLHGRRARFRRRCPSSKPTCWRRTRSRSRAASPQQLDAGLGGRDGHDPRRLPARRRHDARGHAAWLAAVTTRSQTRAGKFSVRDTDYGTAYGDVSGRPRKTPTTGASATCSSPASPWCRRCPSAGRRRSSPTCRWTTTTRSSGTSSAGRRPASGPMPGRGNSAAASGLPCAPTQLPAQRHGLARPLQHRPEPRERLPDRPRGSAHVAELHGHRGHPPAGHGDDREHGPDHGPHRRAPRHHGRADHPHAPPAPGLRTGPAEAGISPPGVDHPEVYHQSLAALFCLAARIGGTTRARSASGFLRTCRRSSIATGKLAVQNEAARSRTWKTRTWKMGGAFYAPARAKLTRYRDVR